MRKRSSQLIAILCSIGVYRMRPPASTLFIYLNLIVRLDNAHEVVDEIVIVLHLLLLLHGAAHVPLCCAGSAG